MDKGLIDEIIGFFIFLFKIICIILLIIVGILIVYILIYIPFYGLPSCIFNYYNDPFKLRTPNVFDENTNLDLYIYLSDNNLKPNFHNSDQLIWSIKNLNYIYNFETGNRPREKFAICKYNSNVYSFNFTTLINTDKYNISDDTLYLHIFIVKNNYLPYFDDNKLYSKNETFHKIKSLNTSDWLSHHTISLLNHKENVNALTNNKSISKLIEYNVETGYYYPILFIDNYSNNYLDKENQYQINKKELLLNLNFNHVNLCQFINYLCDKVTKYDQYYRICIEESPKLSTNFFLFVLDHFMLLLLVLILSTCYLVDLVFNFFFMFRKSIQNKIPPKLKNKINFDFEDIIPIEPNNLSINMIIFECLKSFIFVLYEINRLSSFYCMNEEAHEHYFKFQLFVIYFWVFIFIVSLSKIKCRTDFKSIIKYDKLVYYNLSKILIPLFIAYSYYSFDSYYHKNLYYLIVNTLYGFFLNFGFLIYTSQIYINHKLKSIREDTLVFYYGFFSRSLLILLEDIIDFQTYFKWREPFKLIYLREEIIALYFVYQLLLYAKRFI